MELVILCKNPIEYVIYSMLSLKHIHLCSPVIAKNFVLAITARHFLFKDFNTIINLVIFTFVRKPWSIVNLYKGLKIFPWKLYLMFNAESCTRSDNYFLYENLHKTSFSRVRVHYFSIFISWGFSSNIKVE